MNTQKLYWEFKKKDNLQDSDYKEFLSKNGFLKENGFLSKKNYDEANERVNFFFRWRAKSKFNLKSDNIERLSFLDKEIFNKELKKLKKSKKVKRYFILWDFESLDYSPDLAYFHSKQYYQIMCEGLFENRTFGDYTLDEIKPFHGIDPVDNYYYPMYFEWLKSKILNSNRDLNTIEIERKHQIALILSLGIHSIIKDKLQSKNPVSATDIAKVIAQIIGETDPKKIETIRGYVRDEHNKKEKFYNASTKEKLKELYITLKLKHP